MKTDPPGSRFHREEEGGQESKEGRLSLTAHNFVELSGRQEMSENRLRTGQDRFLLHRSYSERFDWEGAAL